MLLDRQKSRFQWCRGSHTGGTGGLLLAWRQRLAVKAEPAPPTSMQRRNLNSSTCGSRMWSLWGEGSKAIKCKTRAEQSKGLSASVRDTGISVNRERKLKAVSTYCKAL